jgi:hypothetical protein
MQLHLWYCQSEVCRRLNKCADALQVVAPRNRSFNAADTFYAAVKYCRSAVFITGLQLSTSPVDASEWLCMCFQPAQNPSMCCRCI